MKTVLKLSGIVLLSCVCASARAQNLFDPQFQATPPQPAAQPQPATPPTPTQNPAPGDAASPAQSAPGQLVPAGAGPTQDATASPSPAGEALAGYSMFAVSPPPPRRYAKHDLVEVIVNESSVQKFAQTYDNKKDYDLTAELAKFPSLKALIDSATLESGIGTEKPGVGVSSKNKFKGQGKMDRSDQVTARLTATVIDVKPNGTLVLEARESIQSDRETATMVLSGICRQEDITRNNTIQSGQLARLDISVQHEGDVKDTAEKGLIPRVLETIFNF